MYFFNLPGFDPDLGINLDDQGRFPYLRFVDHVFRRGEADYLSRNFHFENIAEKTAPPVFLSEPNLADIFDQKNRANVIVDHHSPISESYADELREQFERGYFDAIIYTLRDLLFHPVYTHSDLSRLTSYVRAAIELIPSAFPSINLRSGYRSKNCQWSKRKLKGRSEFPWTTRLTKS